MTGSPNQISNDIDISNKRSLILKTFFSPSLYSQVVVGQHNVTTSSCQASRSCDISMSLLVLIQVSIVCSRMTESCSAVSWLAQCISTGMWRVCVLEHVTKQAPLTIMYSVYEIIPGDRCEKCSVADLVYKRLTTVMIRYTMCKTSYKSLPKVSLL